MKLGLLVIDMQKHLLNGYVDQQTIDGACEYMNYTAGLLRSKGHPVIHIKDVEGAEDVNDDGIGFIPGIQIESGDTVVHKTFSNAFWKTELESILAEKGVDLLVVSGFAAEYCVLFTYNGALERGFKAAILQRGIVSTKQGAVQDIYRDRHLISYPVIEALVELG
ncbi:cysteine hydrolase family protein [Paenibacillus sp. AR247]|uniref:cysteine hydrolase family protein n=1 Tax=Paenibacillus sp. AR247 TaxID=1631599 RepID=UPI0015E2E8EC|nr:isochorismatase family protein [Paenibacillus sp. AR247]